MTNEIINQKIAQMRVLEEAAASINKQIESIKNELKAELDSRNVDSIETANHNVFYTCYEKAGVDTAKLKAAGIYNDYTKKSTIIQFKITDKKVG